METRIIPLGVNGYIPTFGRQTMSFLVLIGDRAILLDAGSGVARLSEQRIRDLLQPFGSLDVILSHYHLDHVVGLSYLHGLWAGRPMTIYAPGSSFTGCEPEKILNRLISPPLFPIPIDQFPGLSGIVPLVGTATSLGDIPLCLRGQKHAGGSMGVRIGDEIAYVTDTAALDETAAFCAGVSLLLHEVWLTDEEAAVDAAPLAGHAAVAEVAAIAGEAAVKRLMPVHHHPSRDDTALASIVAALASGSGVDVVLPEEGRIYGIE